MEIAHLLTGLAATLAQTAKEVLFKGVDEAIEFLEAQKKDFQDSEGKYDDLAIPFIDVLIEALDNVDGDA